jgi:4-hydroxy-4-methyl-2-oxoglutarate aldolase
MNKRKIHGLVIAIGLLALSGRGVTAQNAVLSRDELVAYTQDWKGNRFPDGRPKVPDSILDRMKSVELEEAWSTLYAKGYQHQFEGNWNTVHLDQGAVLVGRALTASFMPKRPDVDKVLTDKGHQEGHIGGRNSWPIDMLQPRDVYVANAWGNADGAPIIGGNLGTAIYANSHNGIVFDGYIRDLAQLESIQGFTGFVRGWHPSWNYDNMLVAINRPTRIGAAIVMPGDVVLANREGVVFIPPQFAEEVCKRSEVVRLRDMFGFQRIKEGVYTPGQIDQRWTDEMEKDFSHWLEDHMDALPVPKEQIQEILKDRSW